MRPVRIEPLTEEHRDAAVALWRETGLTRPWNDPDADYAFALAGPTSTVLGAFDGDRLVGTAMTGHDGHRGWVYYLAVAPDAQRRGVGRALMEAAEARQRAQRVPAMNIMVRTTNAQALGFYERLGYDRGEVVLLGKRLDGARRMTATDRSEE